MCYQCENIQETITGLKAEKFMLFQDIAPAPVIGENAKVAFLISAKSGMIELVEE
jgi:hypothetical protein